MRCDMMGNGWIQEPDLQAPVPAQVQSTWSRYWRDRYISTLLGAVQEGSNTRS